MSINPQDSQKILLGFILFLIISIIWSSLFILKNPYTYPTNYWLNFMMGFIFYIVILMIDSTIAKLQLINTFQSILIILTIFLNAILIANTYRKFVTIPPHLVTVIISLNGFMSAHVVNYLLSFNVDKLKKQTQSPPQTTRMMTTMPPTTMSTTTMSTTTMPTTTIPTTTMPTTTMPTTTTKLAQQVLPGQLRSLNMDMYDFGAFDLTEERADTPDSDYFRDFAAQYRDEEELNSDDYIEDDYIEDDFIEDDYAEEDYIEDDFTEEY